MPYNPPGAILRLQRLSNRELARLLGWNGRALDRAKSAVDGRGRYIRYWLPEEHALLGKAPDAEVARVLRRSIPSVMGMRVRLKILAFGYTPPRKWMKAEIDLIGRDPDREVARMLGCSTQAVATKRKALNIPYRNPLVKKWSKREETLLGNYSDAEVARRTGRTVVGIKVRRMRKHIQLKWSSVESSPQRPSAKKSAVRQRKKPSRPMRPRPSGRSPNAPIFRPWTEKEFKLLGTDTDKVIAKLIGRSRGAVEAMRLKWEIPLMKSDVRPWTPREDRLIGTAWDNDVAKLVGRTALSVKKRRIRLGIPACSIPRPRPKSAHHHLLGVIPDSEIMKLSGRTRASIKSERRRFGIPPAPAARFWRPHELALLGKAPDEQVAARLKRSVQSIASRREAAGIKAFGSTRRVKTSRKFRRPI